MIVLHWKTIPLKICVLMAMVDMIMDNDTLYAFFLIVQFNTLAFKATSETPPCVFFPYLAYPGCSSEAGFEAQTHSSHQRPPLVFPPFSQFWQHLPA